MLQSSDFARRRQRLVRELPEPILLMGHRLMPRNYPANPFPFRQDSTFLYYTGWQEPDAAALLTPEAGLELFLPPPHEDDDLWHGPVQSLEQARESTGADRVRPRSELPGRLAELGGRALAPPVAEPQALAELKSLAGAGFDSDRLIERIVEHRLKKEPGEISRIRAAVEVTRKAHEATRQMCRPGELEQTIAGQVMRIFTEAGHAEAYGSIITVRGEILHCKTYRNTLEAGQILLIDAGCETADGYASDITRCFPVSGRFDSFQRDVYSAVLRAQEAAIQMCRPGIRYLDVHLAACRSIAESLVQLKLLRGRPEDLVEQGAHALFFPHGIGHLLGLDVHDMEAFGDRAGYAPGRRRSPQFGTAYLRLDRDLEPGMVVTIEPGIYFVPAILGRAAFRDRFSGMVDFERAERMLGFGGIRIEDDILVTEHGPENISSAIPKALDQIEKEL